MKTELSTLPQLHLLNKLNSPLPLEHTAVQAQVTGLVATVTVSQRFRNPLTSKADLEYLFPLPHAAAVTAFELRVAERVIRASVQEIEQARQQFSEARRQGKRASLLESRRPNLFALQLANIQPGEFILAVTSYQQRLELIEGSCEFVFPMGLTPKYHRPAQADEASGVDAPLTLDLSQVGDLEINLEAETGLPSGEPASPSHALIISRLAETRFSVTLDGPHLPNRDFVLRWKLAGESLLFPAWSTAGAESSYFLATFIPPAPDNAAAPLPREYVFVLDRSGSMSGAPIRQAVNALRACLRSLNPQDSFAILLFDDRLEWLSPPTAVTQAAIDQVDGLLEQIDGRGGTDILPALEAALSLAIDPQRTRLVIFLTDGAVSAEAETLQRTRAHIGMARLFSFGVGPSVNRAFLQQLARIGRGQATFIGLEEDIEEAILRFQDQIAYPLLTNLSLRAENGQVWDVYPAQLPDLYAGLPLEVVGRFSGANSRQLPVTLVAQGERAGISLEIRALLSDSAPDPSLLAHLWARARVDDLSEQSELGLKSESVTRAEIIPLALEASLLTKYTAFLAVDSDSPAVNGISQFIRVAQPLPEGLDLSGFVNPSAPPSMVSASRRIAETQVEWDIPTFLRDSRPPSPAPNRARPAKHLLAPKSEIQPKPVSASLPELARTQRLNGSWSDDVESTAAALLAFVRQGHTTSQGHYRKQVSRMFSWLTQSSTGGFAAWLCALALRELANATADPHQLAAADQAFQQLPAPASGLEAAVLSALKSETRPLKPHDHVSDLDGLRLAVVVTARNVKIAPGLFSTELGRILAAALKA